MKIIHFSDIHIHSKPILGHNPIERFRLALNHLKNNHLDSNMFVVTGDITHDGDLASYKKFDEILTKANLPDHLYPKLLMGNHDDRQIFKSHFTITPTDKNGFVQYDIEIEDKRFLFLDTVQKNSHAGHYCDKRQSWLENKLDESLKKSQNVFIFMHHNPFPLVQLESDLIGLLDRDRFRSIIENYKNIIKHIFFGHQHITVSGNYVGIPFSSPRSINHPLVPNFSNEYRLGSANTEPSYNIALINNDSLIIHNEDFLKVETNWFETTKSGWIEERDN